MSDPGPQLWLVRHGATEWSENGRHTSYTDLPLLPEGEAAARSLAPRLADHGFALVLTSPRQRARDTARLAGFPDAVVDDDLREWDYGELEGLTTAQIRQRTPGWTIWSGAPEDGETIEEVAARVDGVIRRIRSQLGPHDVAALVAHGHVLRVLAARWVGAPPDAGRWLALDTGSISELGWERDTAVVRHWNVTAE